MNQLPKNFFLDKKIFNELIFDLENWKESLALYYSIYSKINEYNNWILQLVNVDNKKIKLSIHQSGKWYIIYNVLFNNIKDLNKFLLKNDITLKINI